VSLTILLQELTSFQRTTNDFNKTEKWKVIRTFTFWSQLLLHVVAESELLES